MEAFHLARKGLLVRRDQRVPWGQRARKDRKALRDLKAPKVPKDQADPPDHKANKDPQGPPGFGVVITVPENMAVGDQALFNNFGQNNTATGFKTLFNNSKGAVNVAIGDQALFANDVGNGNTAVGAFALSGNIAGNSNTAIGDETLVANTSGSGNSSLGNGALNHNMNGGFNTAIGVNALFGNITGSQNVAMGRNAGNHVITANNVICIGSDVPGDDVSNSCFIGNIFGQTSSGGIGVFIRADGKLGTTTSSQRFKEEIKPMADTSDALFRLRPVTFRYNMEIDRGRTPQFGLVAEDVEKVNADLVVRDKEGKPYSVRYDQVNAMLLNEFLKTHKRMAEQDKRIEELTTQLKKQAAEIQKVSAQLEVTRAEPQTVLTQ